MKQREEGKGGDNERESVLNRERKEEEERGARKRGKGRGGPIGTRPVARSHELDPRSQTGSEMRAK